MRPHRLRVLGPWDTHRNQSTTEQAHPCPAPRGPRLRVRGPWDTHRNQCTTEQAHPCPAPRGLLGSGSGDRGILIETSVPQTRRTPAQRHEALGSGSGDRGLWDTQRNQCNPDQAHPCPAPRGPRLRVRGPWDTHRNQCTTDQAHPCPAPQGLLGSRSGDRGILIETSAPQTRPTTDKRYEVSSAQGPGTVGYS
ncbi:hypothetical protein NDU88_009022 [Pleurodeles waltl]|uniref:Uncharacterized protein n=1 Tax=Pleurodeles waltl TaxID=8319 RepID=A0AAV7NAL5_PLEWA|nr:hypothetical protein NDU88_009022 [Pleurodeles waltl]